MQTKTKLLKKGIGCNVQERFEICLLMSYIDMVDPRRRLSIFPAPLNNFAYPLLILLLVLFV